MERLAYLLFLLPVLILLAVGIAIFNRLVRLRNRLREGWSGIDVQLKRRHELVPNLVETVKAYQKHEAQLLTDVTRHRSEAAAARSAGDAMGPEKALASDLGRILMLAEAYPDLKASGPFRELGANLVKIEEDLQFARRYYNGCVRDLNNLVETFPAMLIAGPFGFKKAEYFELDSVAASLPPDLGKLLGKTGEKEESR